LFKKPKARAKSKMSDEISSSDEEVRNETNKVMIQQSKVFKKLN
jgi:hypothetical protein